jgi:AI-2 transport protein TqsA
MSDDRPHAIRPLLAILVIIAVIAALKVTAPVTMPLAVALFVVILAWPLQLWLERKRVPRGLGYLLTLLAILLVFSCFVGLLAISVQNVANKAPQYEGRIAELVDQIRWWVDEKGVTDTSKVEEEGASPETILQAVRTAIGWGYGLLGMFTLAVTFTILGLVEVHQFQQKLGDSVRGRAAARLYDIGGEVSVTLRRYMLARTIVSGATGILVGLYTWAIGLDFPLVWGVTSFLLNYLPILGSIVAVVPPSLFALLHPEWWMFFAALGGLTLIQFTIGNLIDPQIEGKILSMSPFVLFLSIVFWGWVWSIPGALLGIPITATIVIFCGKFEATRWLANLLTK